MKQRNILQTIFVFGLLSLADLSALQAQEARVSIGVDGLSCPFCAYGLEKKLKNLDGVTKLEIKINDGLAILTFADSSKVDTTAIAKKVKEAGFTPGKITIERKKEKRKMEGKKISLRIEGMSCDGCVANVRAALEKFDCVRDVEVQLKPGKATFVCTDASRDPGSFAKAVNELGYKAELQQE